MDMAQANNKSVKLNTTDNFKALNWTEVSGMIERMQYNMKRFTSTVTWTNMTWFSSISPDYNVSSMKQDWRELTSVISAADWMK